MKKQEREARRGTSFFPISGNISISFLTTASFEPETSRPFHGHYGRSLKVTYTVKWPSTIARQDSCRPNDCRLFIFITCRYMTPS